MGTDNCDHQCAGGRRFVVIPQKKNRIIFNPALISLALASYIMYNQIRIPSISNHLIATSGLESSDRSLISFAYASPAPDPAPASGRSATSGSHRVPPMNGSIFGKRAVDSLRHSSEQTSDKSDTIPTHEGASRSGSRSDQRDQEVMIPALHSEAVNYKDMITNIIEEFLALNNESDPDEASAAFCRMIVYECSQMLTAKKQSIAKLRRRKMFRSQTDV